MSFLCRTVYERSRMAFHQHGNLSHTHILSSLVVFIGTVRQSSVLTLSPRKSVDVKLADLKA